MKESLQSLYTCRGAYDARPCVIHRQTGVKRVLIIHPTTSILHGFCLALASREDAET